MSIACLVFSQYLVIECVPRISEKISKMYAITEQAGQTALSCT